MSAELPHQLPGGYLVRRATADDVPGIVALLRDDVLGAARDGDASDPAYRKAFAAIDADPAHVLMVVDAPDGRLAGCLQLTFIPGLSRRGALRALVEAVRIASALRGQGVGNELMGFVIDYARDKGARTVQLTTDATRVAAHRFYRRLGFAASHVGMKLHLDSPPESGPAD